MWKCRLGGEGQFKADFSKWKEREKKTCNHFLNCTKLEISWHSRTSGGSELDSSVRNCAQHHVTYLEWGTWAALFSCTHLEGTWRSRPWLSASPHHSGWGSCRCGWSGSSPGGPVPWPRLWGDTQEHSVRQETFIRAQLSSGASGPAFLFSDSWHFQH